MSLRSLIAHGKALLGTPQESQDGPWAYEVCALSREILEDVFEHYPAAEYVEQEIIPLLNELAKPVHTMKLKPEDSFSNYTPGFTKNIEWRISKLEKYVAVYPSLHKTNASLIAGSNE